MAIVLPEPCHLSPVEKFEAEVSWLIQSAMEQDDEVSLDELVEMIRDAAVQAFQPKPRIRVRAATQHTA